MQPKKVKFSKPHTNIVMKYPKWGVELPSLNRVDQVHFALLSLDSGVLNQKHFVLINHFIRVHLKNRIMYSLRLKPNMGETKKPLQSRQGKGKGSVSTYVCNVSNRSILLVLVVPSHYHKLALSVLRLIIGLLPIPFQIVTF